MPKTNEKRKARCLQEKRRKCQRRHRQHEDVHSFELEVELCSSLLKDEVLKDVYPSVKFNHLDVVDEFCRAADSPVLPCHILLLKACQDSGEADVQYHTQNENPNTCEERESQIIKQKTKANRYGERKCGHSWQLG